MLKADLSQALELIAEIAKAAEGRNVCKNIEISIFMSNFPILLKVSRIIIENYVDDGKINILNEKTAVIEKLFLLSRFAHPLIR